MSLSELATQTGAHVLGTCQPIIGPASLAEASPEQIAVLTDARYLHEARDTTAGCILTSQKLADELRASDREGQCMLVVDAVEAAWHRVLGLFAPPVAVAAAGVHPRAIVAATARISPTASIGPGCIVGDARIGDGCVLQANVTIEDGVEIGEQTELAAGVVVHSHCVIGRRCRVLANAVIGSAGFGFHFDQGRHVRYPHIGRVVLGDDVEVGAGTCIDRAKFGETSVGDGTKIDNLCQIGHNCRIGRNVIIVAQVGLAGSVVVEDFVMLGGSAGVKDHVTIGAGARIGAFGAVMEDVAAGQTVVGVPSTDARSFFREVAALRKLPELLREFRSLTARVKKLEQTGND